MDWKKEIPLMIKTGRTFSTASSNRGVQEPLHATKSLIIIKA
jgi:hypothetical protein